MTDGLAGECHAAARVEKALSVDSDAGSRHSLALAFSVAGNISAALRTFDGNSDRAEALYNIGIVLAALQYGEAIKAFEACSRRCRPTPRPATARSVTSVPPSN